MRVILFGATGMVGQGVLRECLRDHGVEAVLAIGRRQIGQVHPKLRELISKDLFDCNVARSELEGFDACFFCLGVSSAGLSETDYAHLTYDLTTGWARTLAAIDPAINFIYVSGAGTGVKAMWAQVKKRTEDTLLELFPCPTCFASARYALCTAKFRKHVGHGSFTQFSGRCGRWCE